MSERAPKTSLWGKLPQWAWKQGLRTNVDFTSNPDSAAVYRNPERQPQHCADITEAQVITSRIEYPQDTDLHKPILDIDFPIQCVPSTTPGHFHLYMDKELSWEKYRTLLKALAEAGIIEQGYAGASIARGYTAVRPPWVRKEEQPTPAAPEEPQPASAPVEHPHVEHPLADQMTSTARAEANVRPGLPMPIAREYTTQPLPLPRSRASIYPTPNGFWEQARHGEPVDDRITVTYDRDRYEAVRAASWSAAGSDAIADIAAAADSITAERRQRQHEEMMDLQAQAEAEDRMRRLGAAAPLEPPAIADPLGDQTTATAERAAAAVERSRGAASAFRRLRQADPLMDNLQQAYAQQASDEADRVIDHMIRSAASRTRSRPPPRPPRL